ncbi:hypothetical protein K504DRAFT_501311 [Pleomassaria siparia CBS 279.74]|uniref:Uncharacterized protein n=1 Tax=Pleomassaria siparia CBS 279.74 TaxID=1314801 RepID=A0A6G1KBL2_9PLEO|nr:hypothetical protein K504DRAFT_501311 [Pleomassaria siparia CBS 279.74]
MPSRLAPLIVFDLIIWILTLRYLLRCTDCLLSEKAQARLVQPRNAGLIEVESKRFYRGSHRPAASISRYFTGHSLLLLATSSPVPPRRYHRRVWGILTCAHAELLGRERRTLITEEN